MAANAQNASVVLVLASPRGRRSFIDGGNGS